MRTIDFFCVMQTCMTLENHCNCFRSVAQGNCLWGQAHGVTLISRKLCLLCRKSGYVIYLWFNRCVKWSKAVIEYLLNYSMLGKCEDSSFIDAFRWCLTYLVATQFLIKIMVFINFYNCIIPLQWLQTFVTVKPRQNDKLWWNKKFCLLDYEGEAEILVHVHRSILANNHLKFLQILRAVGNELATKI